MTDDQLPNDPGSGPPPYVYALGRIDFRFPSTGVEKEFAQTIGRTRTANLTDRQALCEILAKPENRYLVRELTFVLTIRGTDTYILEPDDPRDFDLLADAVRPRPQPDDLDVVIGHRAACPTGGGCDGRALPVVRFSQIYSFDSDSLIGALEKPEDVSGEQFDAAAKELLARIMLVADNTGAAPEHRAINYLAVRCPSVYRRTFEAYRDESSLSSIEVRPSPVSQTRLVMNVVFAYTQRTTGVTDKHLFPVDATERYPYLQGSPQPYYDH
ncbi:cyanobactin maturation protease PatG family protein [Actinacidiphila paucisporea]|uniref:PatG domain-containing protein n=1 Tax=Actinacidiphila paucisporea TaxID=310782 RepID=A0A1M7MM37_9ACTN|nr:hypothetical protein [Actinacidiphila paucisporea]SHM91944.1 hypothetical protein SAMN05216499_11698 [Actinacidiphila paucisporea]